MPLMIEQVTVDALDPRAQARWWARALGWVVVEEDDHEVEIRVHPDDRSPGLLFLRVDELGPGKNRLHLDLRPDDRDAEVARLLSMGATRVDIGQGDVSWVVLADPEGNELCVLQAIPPEQMRPGLTPWS